MCQYKKITLLVLTFLITNVIWGRDIIIKKHPKKNNSVVSARKGFNINNKYAFVLYYESEIFYREEINGKWRLILPHDELNMDGEIKIDNENGLILLEIDSQKITINGIQKPNKIIDIVSNQNIKKIQKNESSPLIDFFIVPEHLKKTKNGNINRSFEEKNELSFFPKNTKEINVLKNTNTIIIWEKSPYYIDEYKLKISHYFNPKLDTFLFYKDTSVNLDHSLTNECYPCEIKIIEPKNRYTELTIVTKEFDIENEKIYKLLLKKINKENDIYSKVALINFLTKNKFHNTAFFYLNKFYLENKENKYFIEEYKYYLENIFN